MDGGLKALCQVQGSPLPDIQWMSLDNILEDDTGLSLGQEASSQYQTTSQLLDIQAGGQYTCAASNSMGKDQAVVYVLPPNPEEATSKSSSTALPLMLGLALAAKVLVALALGAWIINPLNPNEQSEGPSCPSSLS